MIFFYLKRRFEIVDHIYKYEAVTIIIAYIQANNTKIFLDFHDIRYKFQLHLQCLTLTPNYDCTKLHFLYKIAFFVQETKPVLK